MAEEKKIINDSTSEKNAEKKAKSKSQEKKPNFFVRTGKKFVKFCKDTVGELKKVVWTSKSDVWKSFKLVIATVVALSALIAVIDLVSNAIIVAIAGLIG